MSNVIQLRGYSGAPLCENLTTIDLTQGWYPLDDGSENRAGNDQHSNSFDYTGTLCEGDAPPAFRRGPHDANHYFRPNTWYLTKFHLNTVGADGILELWVREYGSAVWTKWMDWRGGITPATYSYLVDAVNQGVGHQWFKLFTTFNDYDAWVYVADFQVATSEANLENGYAN